MEAGDVLSAAGMGVAAVGLAVSGVRALVRRDRVVPERRLLVCSRFAMAFGCGALAFSFLLLGTTRGSSLLLLVPAVGGFLVSVSLEQARRRKSVAREEADE